MYNRLDTNLHVLLRPLASLPLLLLNSSVLRFLMGIIQKPHRSYLLFSHAMQTRLLISPHLTTSEHLDKHDTNSQRDSTNKPTGNLHLSSSTSIRRNSRASGSWRSARGRSLDLSGVTTLACAHARFICIWQSLPIGNLADDSALCGS
jgi:hypothetical protein